MERSFSYFIFFHLIFTFYSCKRLKCEQFDFNRVLSDSCIFFNNYSYTNGIDTFQFYLQEMYYTESKNRGGIGIHACEPSMSLNYNSKETDFTIHFGFSYLDDEKDRKSSLGIFFGSNYIDIEYDTIMRLGHKIVLDDFTLYREIDVSRKINKLILENLKITEVEFATGEVWRLCAYEDELPKT